MFNNIFTPKNKKTNRELFLAIEIHESLIKSAVWQVEDEKPSIVSLGSYELWDSEDSLINGTDASLTEAIKGLDSQPDRVILGLPESWLVDNKVHPSKQKVIRRLKEDLSIKPIGVVTITEAVIRHLKDQEGIPPTAILLEIYPSKVIVTLVNIGEKQAIEEVGRSDDLARDVEEGLARFDAEKLPARFILTNGTDLSDEEQQIVSYPWTEKLPFVHIPKVQVLPIDFSIRAIALSGGAEAAKSLGIEIVDEAQNQVPVEPVSNPAIDSISDDYSTLGFEFEGEAPDTAVLTETTPVINYLNEAEVDTSETPLVEPEKQTKPGLLSKLSRFSLSGFHLPQPRLPALALSPRTLFIVPLVLTVLLGLFITAYYFYFGRVVVTLAVSPARREQVIEMAIGTNPVADLTNVPAVKKTISAKASDSITTTGEAVVGEKATGKVNVFNYTDTPVTLKQGTKIVKDNLVFNLESQTTIASRSGVMAEDGSIPPGKSEVAVTAGKIGAEYNLDKGAQFVVDTYPQSSLRARSDTAFSGGTSRTVKAVNKEDQEKLLANVSEKIKADIDDQLKREDPDNRSLAVSPLKYTTKDFDHAIGEEAATLNLDLAAEMEVLVYSRQELISQIEGKVLQTANPGQVLAAEHTQVSLTDPIPGDDNNTFTTKANVSAILLPELNREQMASTVKGKSVNALRGILQNVQGYESATVEIYPNLPLLNTFLPLNGERFVFNVITK